MESQLQNPEFRSNPENFHPCSKDKALRSRTKRMQSLRQSSTWTHRPKITMLNKKNSR